MDINTALSVIEEQYKTARSISDRADNCGHVPVWNAARDLNIKSILIAGTHHFHRDDADKLVARILSRRRHREAA